MDYCPLHRVGFIGLEEYVSRLCGQVRGWEGGKWQNVAYYSLFHHILLLVCINRIMKYSASPIALHYQLYTSDTNIWT